MSTIKREGSRKWRKWWREVELKRQRESSDLLFSALNILLEGNPLVLQYKTGVLLCFTHKEKQYEVNTC